MDKLLYIMALLGVCILFSGQTSAAAANGSDLYEKHCSVCHGIEGIGGVGVPLHLPDFLAVASDDYLRKSIRLGRPGRVMPAFPQFSEAEVDAIVAHIRSLSSDPAPVYSSEPIKGDVARGEKIFAQHCAACHGDKGRGKGGTGVTFSRPREAPVMAPSLVNIGFQQSISDAMLKATIIRGRTGTPMPSIKELGLSEADADNLVAFIRSLESPLPPTAVESQEETVISFDSAYSLQQTLENLKEAAIGRNFRVIRLQYLEEGLAKPGHENPRTVMLYFCNFAFLYEALGIDPRVGVFLPCRVTVIETDAGVQVMSINPKILSKLFNNHELDKACEQMHDLYVEIIEEATL